MAFCSRLIPRSLHPLKQHLLICFSDPLPRQSLQVPPLAVVVQMARRTKCHQVVVGTVHFEVIDVGDRERATMRVKLFAREPTLHAALLALPARLMLRAAMSSQSGGYLLRSIGMADSFTTGCHR